MEAETTARREYETASQGAIANPTRISLRFWIKVKIAIIGRIISKRIARLWLFKLWGFCGLESVDAFNFENCFPAMHVGEVRVS